MGTQAEEYEKGDDSIQGLAGYNGATGMLFFIYLLMKRPCVLGWVGLAFLSASRKYCDSKIKTVFCFCF